MSGWRDPYGGASRWFRIGVAGKHGMTPFLGENAESFKREPFTGFVSMNIPKSYRTNHRTVFEMFY